MSLTEEKKKLLIRIDKKIAEEIEQIALSDYRSINGQIEFILSSYLKEHSKK